MGRSSRAVPATGPGGRACTLQVPILVQSALSAREGAGPGRSADRHGRGGVSPGRATRARAAGATSGSTARFRPTKTQLAPAVGPGPSGAAPANSVGW
jgi:hypothetical protein